MSLRRLLAWCIAAVVAILLASCDGEQAGMDCHDEPIPRSAVPVPNGFSVRHTQSIDPEGCGARYKRRAVVTGSAPTSAELLTVYVASLKKDGWTSAECSEPSLRCFTNDQRELFIAVATPETTPTPVVPGPTGDGPQLLVVVEPS